MSKFRFAGTLKELETSSSSKMLYFAPDQECTVSEDRNGKKATYVIFLPADNGEGIAFKYEGKLKIVVQSKAKWLPAWKVNGRYELLLEPGDDKNHEVEVPDAPTSKYFNFESVAEKA